MDAIYKTTKYGFPCFFLVVKMSLGIGRVAATIIPQYETTEMIKEGLQILKLWNPQWKPKFFMTDKSSQELEAVAAVHPTCIRYICDFHRGQAFERWVNRAANGVTPTTRNLVLDSMKRLAYAPTGTYHNNHYTHLHCMFIPNIYTPLTTYRYMNTFKQFWVRSRCSLGTLTTPNCRNTSRMNGWTVNQ